MGFSFSAADGIMGAVQVICGAASMEEESVKEAKDAALSNTDEGETSNLLLDSLFVASGKYADEVKFDGALVSDILIGADEMLLSKALESDTRSAESTSVADALTTCKVDGPPDNDPEELMPDLLLVLIELAIAVGAVVPTSGVIPSLENTSEALGSDAVGVLEGIMDLPILIDKAKGVLGSLEDAEMESISDPVRSA